MSQSMKAAITDLVVGYRRQMQQIARDERFSRDYKHAEIKKMGAAAAAEIQSRIKTFNETFETTKKTLTDKAYFSPVPSPDEAAQLNYTKSALAAQWETMTLQQMTAAYEAALTTKDRITARIYYDFGSVIAGRKIKLDGNRPFEGVPVHWTPLNKRAEEMLLNDEQKRARQRLVEIEAERVDYLSFAGPLQVEMQSAGYDAAKQDVGQRVTGYERLSGV